MRSRIIFTLVLLFTKFGRCQTFDPWALLGRWVQVEPKAKTKSAAPEMVFLKEDRLLRKAHGRSDPGEVLRYRLISGDQFEIESEGVEKRPITKTYRFAYGSTSNSITVTCESVVWNGQGSGGCATERQVLSREKKPLSLDQFEQEQVDKVSKQEQRK